MLPGTVCTPSPATQWLDAASRLPAASRTDSVYEPGWSNLTGNVALPFASGASVPSVRVRVSRRTRSHLAGGALAPLAPPTTGIGVSVNETLCPGVVKFDVVDSLYGVAPRAMSNSRVTFTRYAAPSLANTVTT